MEKATPSAVVKVTRIALLSGVLAPGMLAAVIVIVGQVSPGYDPLTQTISQAGTSANQYAAFQNTGFIFYGLIILVTAYGFYRILGRGAAALLAGHGLASILLGVFADSPDFPGKPLSQDMLHNVFATVAYVCLLLSVFFLMRIGNKMQVFRKLNKFGVVVLVLSVPVPFLNIFEFVQSVGGLMQRLFMFSSLLWVTLASLNVYRFSFSPGVGEFLQEKEMPSDSNGGGSGGTLSQDRPRGGEKQW